MTNPKRHGDWADEIAHKLYYDEAYAKSIAAALRKAEARGMEKAAAIREKINDPST